MRYLLLLLLLLLPSITLAQTTIDNCTFVITGDIDLATSNTACETPTGNDAWTETFDDCTSTIIAVNSTDTAYVNSSSLANCAIMYEAPVDPATTISGAIVDVYATIRDIGSATTSQTACIWSGADSDNYYSICAIDDAGSAFRVYKQVANVNTSLGTYGAFSAVETASIRLSIGVNYFIRGYDEDVGLGYDGTDTSLMSFTKAGIGGGEIQVNNNDVAWVHDYDDFSVVETSARERHIILINKLINMFSPRNSFAQEQIRDGRWYVTPVIKVDGIRVPQVDIYTDPGRPLLEDDLGGFTIPDKCRYSANIGSADVTNEWALVYVSCIDYSNIDSDNTNILITDEKIDVLTKKLSAMPANRRNKMIQNIENKTGANTGLTTESTVEEWLNALGKLINANFKASGTYAR